VTQRDDDKDRKERVLHTRVPAVLEDELRRLAVALRVPVSNVVRTILEDAVDTIDSVGQRAEGELRGVRDRLRQRRDRLGRNDAPARAADGRGEASEPTPPLAGVIGFQPMLLARDERCTLCGRELRAGDPAYLGMRDGSGPRVLLDQSCLPASVADRANQEKKP
jgi:hypothetical protein